MVWPGRWPVAQMSFLGLNPLRFSIFAVYYKTCYT
jgi:hypothetical protein